MYRIAHIPHATLTWTEPLRALISKTHLEAAEQEIAASCGAHVVAFSSGRGALAAAVEALGDARVEVTAFTCAAVPSAVLGAGAKPVFLDDEACSRPAWSDTSAAIVQDTYGFRGLALAAQLRTIRDCYPEMPGGIIGWFSCICRLAERHFAFSGRRYGAGLARRAAGLLRSPALVREARDEASGKGLGDMVRGRPDRIALALMLSQFRKASSVAQYSTTDMFTHVVDLSPSESELYSNLSNGCRGKVNKARRQGLTMEPATRASEADEYSDAYEDSIRRWGDKTTRRYEADIFRKIVEIGPDNARIWLVKRDGVTLGGIVVFYHARHAVHWHSGYFESAFAHGASNFAVWEATKDAKRAGLRGLRHEPERGPRGRHRGLWTVDPYLSALCRPPAAVLPRKISQRTADLGLQPESAP